jgi:RepB DNA-primase N-terminal domain
VPSSTNDKRAATHVIETWWQRLGAPGYVCLAVGDPPRSFFSRQETVDVERFIRGEDGEHLFFCPHTFALLQPGADGFQAAFVKNHRNLLGRIKECSVPCAALWADLDGVDPNKFGALEPTIAWETSPQRYQALWLTDGIVADISLNKRLTYHLGADKGGWCQTKLLRLPGSRNQKYRPPPLALVLWDDGPVHRLAELERLLPPLAEPKVHAPLAHRRVGEGGIRARINGSTPEQILAAHNIPGALKQVLLHGQPNGEDRSRALWRFACELRECGMPADAAYVVLAHSVWSRGREDDVERVIGKIWGQS